MRLTNKWPISKHFLLSEFEERDTHLVMIHPVLIATLEEIRQVAERPIEITSGYRGAKHNADVGGVQNSLHLWGAAADIGGPQDHLDDIYKLATRLPRVHALREQHHVHIEVATAWL